MVVCGAGGFIGGHLVKSLLDDNIDVIKAVDVKPRCRVARYHNVYGPHGTWTGGREKAPAAICRKVEAKHSGNPNIEIWGDGSQTCCFMYIDDCLKGSRMIMESDFHEPVNLGSTELVTTNQLVDIVEGIAGIELIRHFNLNASKGVNGRNSDNSLIEEYLGREPSIALRHGMAKTYEWISTQMTLAIA